MRNPSHAVVILGLVGLSSAVCADAGRVPSGAWTLKICVLHAPTTNTPCAYLSDQLTLLVENPTWPPAAKPKVVFERAIAPAMARQIHDQALKAITSIRRLLPSQVVTDGTTIFVELNSSETAQFTGMSVNDAGPDAVKLVSLLKDTTGLAF
jgi:hypothetical protein